MKKFSTLLLSSLFSLSLFAFDGNRLSITTVNNNLKLKIEVDGQKVNMQGNRITLTNLSEGNHNVRVYRAKNITGFRRSYDYGYEIIYATTVYIGSDCQVDVTITDSGKVFMDSYRIDSDNECNNDDQGGYGYNGVDKLSGNIIYDNVMSTREFNQVKEQISKEWLESNKLISVKTISDKNNFTTEQVKELMLLFTFENNRMEVVKYAYCNIVDKQNIYQLNDVVTFSSSKDELARFIREQK